MTARKLLVLGLLVAIGACSKDADVQENSEAATATTSNQQAEEDLADITKYDLSMDKMDKYFQTMRNLAASLKEMTPEQRAAVEMNTDQNATLDQMIAQAKGNKVIDDAARKAGSSARDYVMTSVAYMQSAMAMAVMQMQPNANQDSLAREMKANPNNIKFIKDNEAALTTKYKAIEAEMNELEALDEAEGN